ncbi:zinc transporter ZitB-like [Brevipalpus obovatus]|uniref:zinc transporter ZitB-like n=1 Tax=Brevipalpus obovatus TaxID=246614 RepID=UPI003D9F416B
MKQLAHSGDLSLLKGYIFSLIYFLLFLAEFSCYFLTYSEAIVADGYYNLFISGLWMIKICNKSTSNNSKSKRSTFGWSRLEGFAQLCITAFASALFFSVTTNSIQKMFSNERKLFFHYEIFLVVFGITGFLANSIIFVIASTDVKIIRDGDESQKQCIVSFTDHFGDFITNLASSLLLLICALINLAGRQLINIGAIDGLTALIIVCMQLGPLWNMYQESGRVLLQCIPSSFNLDQMRRQVQDEFPEIIDLHELHVWQLKQGEIVMTCHLMVDLLAFESGAQFRNRMIYLQEYFKLQGITDLTIQFEYLTGRIGNPKCLVTCPSPSSCENKKCCSPPKIAP